jgi:transmembrane sensor
MSASPDRAMVEQAIAWHLKLKDADEDAWIEFAAWLGANPARNAVYEAVADGDARLSVVLGEATLALADDPARPPEFGSEESSVAYRARGEVPRRSPWRGDAWRWGALAASIAVAGVIAVQTPRGRDEHYSIETAAGETRAISLADGSQILLNGDTKIVLDRTDARRVEIARGEARFSVEHNAADPFTVVAGEQRLVDIGTVFNVVRTDRQLRVGIAEGAVRFEGATRTVNLRAGDSLAADSRGQIHISQGPVASIGSWADGKLVYDQASWEEVAHDLSRSIGITLELPREMRSTRFSGVIQTRGGANAVHARLEELIGAEVVVEGARWTVKPGE